ncbi:MAG TPA: hypothetical protein VIV12_12655 [Streptosporangiaceae bacterium]
MNAWRRAGPELVVAAIIMLAAGAAGFGLAGPAGAAVAAVLMAAGWLTVVRALAAGEEDDRWQAGDVPGPAGSWDEPTGGVRGSVLPAASFTWNWRSVFQVKQATESMASYDAQLRPRLEHLLAARLAERHSVNLYADPDTARRLLCRDGADADLWYWVDPQRPPVPDRTRAGIGRRALARLLTRLERL